MSDPRPRRLDCRAAAARVVAEVALEGRSLSDALPRWQERVPARDRPLLQELAYGTLRWHGRLQALLDRLLQRPFKRKDGDLEALLRVGLYQLLHTRIPDHAAVAATVAATAALGKGWARKLCNAVLRRFLREREALLAEADRDDAARLAHPPWLLEMLQAAYPDRWREIATAANERPPMTLRINRLRGDRDTYRKRLEAEGISARPGRFGPDALVLERPVDVARLPGFEAGEASVQDEAAQLAAILLDPAPGDRVLDACAAPGGKSAHLLERQPELAELVALDADEARLGRLEQNLARLGLDATVARGDAAAPEQWWDGRPFQRILLDAPCSATGVIRRHPDIKLLRRPDDIDALATLQGRILDALWPLLEAGGMLLYATCSILPRENHEQLQAFLARHDDAREEPIEAAWGHAVAVGRQILPGEDEMDGFYYARIRKLA